MGRPQMPPGTWGKIRRQQVRPNLWRARSRFRDFDGITRDVEASGRTGPAAERALLDRLTTRQGPQSGPTEITSGTTIAALGTIWLAEIVSEDRLSVSTLRNYTRSVETITVALGGVRLAETKVSTVDRFFKALIAEGKLSKPRNAKIVLGQMFSLAVRHDAISLNPVREISRIPKPKHEIRSMRPADLLEVYRATAVYDAKAKPAFLSDFVTFMLGTGARIGEALAVRWSDIDLGATKPTVTISGTIQQFSGVPIYRQNWTKNTAGYRVVVLPRFAVDMLLARKVFAPANDLNAVFCTRNGTWMSPNNVRRAWRTVRKTIGFDWVTPHTFRKTVATLLDDQLGSKVAAAQLGHASERTTEKHYISKPDAAPDVSHILQQLSGEAPTDKDAS